MKRISGASVRGAVLAIAPFLVAPALSAQSVAMARDTAQRAAVAGPDSSQALVGLLVVANRDEIDAAKLATEKATRADVKAYAAKLVDEHTKALDELVGAPRAKGIARDDTTNQAQRSGMPGIAGQYSVNSLKSDSLARLQGNSPVATVRAANVAAMQKLNSATKETFDQTFLATQVEGHELLLKTLEKQSTSDAKLQAAVASMKTSVQQHLEEAKKLQATP